MLKTKNQAICLLLGFLLLLSMSLSAFAVQRDVSVIIDGEEIQFTNDSGRPFIDENNRTQVPLRIVMEKYGCHVEWDSTNYSAIITKNGTTVIVPIGESFILVNGNKETIDTASLIQDNRTFLPIRAVLEAFGADVKWNDGVVIVTSPSSNQFDNIFINEDGELIFVLSNGNKINAGKVPSGKDGRDGFSGADGVSVKNAYVDAASNLMIELSNGRTINAGNVGVGGSMSGLTFADYPVGTKFYLTLPSGSFSVPVKLEPSKEDTYIIEYDCVYYELTAKHDPNGAETWIDGTFWPFEITVYLRGKTDASLSGYYVVTRLFLDGVGTGDYIGKIMENGSFSVERQVSWYAPSNMYMNTVRLVDFWPGMD